VALPPAEWYGDFEQRENGVGAVRYLQTRIHAARAALETEGWRDKRIGIVTGTAMGPLLPQVHGRSGRGDRRALRDPHAREHAVRAIRLPPPGCFPARAVLAALQGPI